MGGLQPLLCMDYCAASVLLQRRPLQGFIIKPLAGDHGMPCAVQRSNGGRANVGIGDAHVQQRKTRLNLSKLQEIQYAQ